MDERKGRDSVILHMEDFEDIGELKDGDAGKLLKAILAYTLDPGAELPKLGLQAKTMFGYIRRHMDRDRAKYEETCTKRAAAGKKGGRPRKDVFDFPEKAKKANGFFEKQNNPDTDTDTDTDTEPDTDTDTEPDTEPVAAPGGGPGGGDSGLWSSAQEKENRMKYLDMMCDLYERGALEDDETYRRLSRELEVLRGGAR